MRVDLVPFLLERRLYRLSTIYICNNHDKKANACIIKKSQNIGIRMNICNLNK